MAKAKKIIEVPFDSSGQMLRRCYRSYATNVTFAVAPDFEDIIQFQSIQRTSSSNYAVFKSKTSVKKYYMFMKDFEKMIQTQVLKLGIISGKFTFVQRGVSFGIRITSVSKLEVLT